MTLLRNISKSPHTWVFSRFAFRPLGPPAPPRHSVTDNRHAHGSHGHAQAHGHDIADTTGCSPPRGSPSPCCARLPAAPVLVERQHGESTIRSHSQSAKAKQKCRGGVWIGRNPRRLVPALEHGDCRAGVFPILVTGRSGCDTESRSTIHIKPYE